MNEADRNEVTPKLEATIASELRALVAEIPVGAEFRVPPSEDFCASLEIVLSRLLGRRHPEWEKESLDGFFVAIARKTGAAAVQLAGTCILISDQTVTPFLVELALSPTGETIASFRVYLGEPGEGRLGISGPECNSREADELLIAIPTRLHDINWTYKIASDEV